MLDNDDEMKSVAQESPSEGGGQGPQGEEVTGGLCGGPLAVENEDGSREVAQAGPWAASSVAGEPQDVRGRREDSCRRLGPRGFWRR